MHYAVTMTIKQLSTLRLMLRLQKVKAMRRAVQKAKQNLAPEAQVLLELLQRDDLITAVDLPLMRAEGAVVGGQETIDPRTPVDVAFDEMHLEVCRRAAEAPYSADSAFGGQAEQGVVLQILKEEAEGLRLALVTATPLTATAGTPIFQQLPRGRQ